MAGTAAIGQGLMPGQRSSVEIIGGTLEMPTNPNTVPAPGGIIFAPVQRDPTGKPCLIVAPLAQPQILNNKIFDHILLLDNRCGQEIRIRACYYKTDSCKVMSVGGYKRQQQILGVFPSKDFRFSYREFVR